MTPKNINDFSRRAAEYLFKEHTLRSDFCVSPEAAHLHDSFLADLKTKKAVEKYENSILALKTQAVEQLELVRHWLRAYIMQKGIAPSDGTIEEAAVLLLCGGYKKNQVVQAETKSILEGMHGEHRLVEGGKYTLDYSVFSEKMQRYSVDFVPQFEAFQQSKRELSDTYRKKLRLEEFKPKVLSSFVRNQLIDKVYLPIFGDNLAKQIGTVGEETRTDRMGLLLLISPPGYGKTTLMEYIANRLGLIFMKINGPALGHHVVSLDPEEAPNRAAAQELEKLNLALEMGDNVMIYLDDIQHSNPEFLQKFISLCDAQRKIEGIWKGETKTYDFRGKRVCVVMAGNPYTESGERFQVPDMLANRADIYNLGDILGDNADVFKMSYIENSLTSNAILAKLSGKSRKDVYTLVKMIETGQQEGLTFEANHSPVELNEYTTVLTKLLRVRDVVLAVNQGYIQSAATADDYRTEPPFHLQGSYRNMNKLAEKIAPIMNDKELETLLLAHYEGEAQTLTSGAEANMLKLKELMGNLTEQEIKRWKEIKATFVKNNKMKGMGEDNAVGQVVLQLDRLAEGVEKLRQGED